MNVNNSLIPVEGVVLSSDTLAVEQDVVSLCRRIRLAAEQVGLDDRSTRSLSTAAYQAGRMLLTPDAPAHADVRIAETALQVQLTAAPGDAPDTRRSLRRALEPLRSLVDRLAIDDAGRMSVLLSSRFVGASSVFAESRPAATPLAAAVDLDAAKLRDENESLRRAVRELQIELQESNRGVVALYAELDDVTGRLEQAEARVGMFLDSAQDCAICMLDEDGAVSSWNAGAERLFGYDAEAIGGRPFDCFYTSADRERGLPAEHLRTARATGRCQGDGRRVRRRGEEFDASVLLTSVTGAHDRIRGFSLVVRDVTERKRLEDDLRRRAEDLAAANRATEDFLATLSHELRTPLNAMLGWTRLLRLGKLDRAAHDRALETIERNARVQELLIADILDVSRIVTGKLQLRLRPVDLVPIIDAAVDSVRPAAAVKGVQLGCDVRSAGTIMGDPDRLQQVVWNLLSNAVKFTPGGGRVSISLVPNGSSVLITVCDTGEGITPGLLPVIFDRFTQGDASLTRTHGGLGLGLSIVRHLVELHGGQVNASSDGAGCGSQFFVRLPLPDSAPWFDRSFGAASRTDEPRTP